MLPLLLLNILEGVIFAAIGAIMTRVAIRNISIVSYYFVCAALTTTIFAAFFVRWDAVAEAPYLREMILYLVGGALINNCGHLMMLSNMRRGHKAASWAIGQSSLIVPFLAAAVLFDEQPGVGGWIGIALVVVGIVALAAARRGERGGKTDLLWVVMVILNFICYGVSQAITALPSHWPGYADTANLRVFLQMGAGAAFMGAMMLYTRQGIDLRALPFAGAYACLSLPSFVLLFWLLDRMTVLGESSIVWPVAVGTCIVVFSVYSLKKIREPFSLLDLLGIAGITGGIALLALC